MNLVAMVQEDAEWVINSYGSDAEERMNPGSKAKAQAERIARFVQQALLVNELLQDHEIDLVTLHRA